jgi:hypothetical protein
VARAYTEVEMAQTETTGGDQNLPYSNESVTAKVGKKPQSTQSVPKQVGSFEHREVPNGNTTAWTRTWSPTDEKRPRFRLSYKITCEHGNWEVVRSAVIENNGFAVNVPNNRPSVVQDVRDVTRVAEADDMDHALAIAIEAMNAATALPTHTPPVLSETGVASFRDLEQGGDGNVDPKDVEDLVGGN